MKNNNQPMTPSGLFSARQRFNSINSPFISPLQIVQSPCINDGNMNDNNFGNSDLNHFQLQDQAGQQNEQDNINEGIGEQQEQSSIRYPSIPELEHSKDVILDQNNMLEFVLTHINRHNRFVDESRSRLQNYGSEFNKRLFDYLVNKFKKLRKTKEEMVKYCVRKSFKYVTNKMRSANKEAYINMENNEVVAQYFEMNCQGDISISMPFKKNSEQKTMNSNFLKKIFKCRQYNIDYKEFLRQFPDEYSHDNNKKIKSMNEAIKKCCRNKCFKSLDEYKRLPWTIDLLEKIFEFAKQLMEHSPYKKENLQLKSDLKNMHKIERPFQIHPITPNHHHSHHQQQQVKNQALQSSGMQDQFQIIKNVPKKSVIILTPPIRALNEPSNMNNIMDDIDLL